MATGNFNVGAHVCVEGSNLELCGWVRDVDEGGNVVIVDGTNAEWSFPSDDLVGFQTEVCSGLLDRYLTNEALRKTAESRHVGYKISLGDEYFAEQYYSRDNKLVKEIAAVLGCPLSLFTSVEDDKSKRALIIDIIKGSLSIKNKPNSLILTRLPTSEVGVTEFNKNN